MHACRGISSYAVRELSLAPRGGGGLVDHLGGLVPVRQGESVVAHKGRQLVAWTVDVVGWPHARLQGACR